MKFITPPQSCAARALLNWSQPDLARKCDMHKQTISNFEAGRSSLSKASLEKMTDIFELNGIEFTENDGVRWKSRDVVTYKGRDGMVDFLLNVYDVLKDGGQVFVDNVSEDDFERWEGNETGAHLARMTSIKNLDFRIIIGEGDTNIVASDYAEYRCLPQKKFGSIPLYMYGEKTALIVFSENDVEVYVINHPAITSYFKGRFLLKWKEAKKV